MLNKKQFTLKLAKRIRHLRKKKGMSQEELALEAGLYRTYVGHIETGRYSPSVYIVWKIAKALKTPLPELLRFV